MTAFFAFFACHGSWLDLMRYSKLVSNDMVHVTLDTLFEAVGLSRIYPKFECVCPSLLALKSQVLQIQQVLHKESARLA